jgi:phosphate starvation-inducible PhoH-like protein
LTKSWSPEGHKSDTTDLELAFEDNRLASQLYGEFDQNLALIEQKLGVRANTRGNHVMLSGSAINIDQARRTLESLYAQLEDGQDISIGDVDGVIRMIITEDSQLTLPTFETKGRVRMAQIATRKSTIVARSPAQDGYIRAMDRTEMVFGVGPAGTGKTYLAVAYAATLLERGDISRIILSRPAVEAGEHLGFLPGDMKDKVDPYLRPLYDALYDMMQPEIVDRCIENRSIEVAPLAFMRGRTLANAVVILDEAQNTTAQQMKMFLTRLGENSKMIITGDPSQVDLPRGVKSGLAEALDFLSGVQGIHVTRFTDKDVVRHEMVARIIRAYEKAEKKARNADK